MSQLLSYETIVKASEGDPEAVAAVLTCPSIGLPLEEQKTRLKSTNSSPKRSFSSSMSAFRCTNISATVFGNMIRKDTKNAARRK